MIKKEILFDNIHKLNTKLDYFVVVEVARYTDNVRGFIQNNKRFELIRWKLIANENALLDFINTSKDNTRVYIIPVPVQKTIIDDLDVTPEKSWDNIHYYCKHKFWNIDVDCTDEDILTYITSSLNEADIKYEIFNSKRGFSIVVNDSDKLYPILNDIRSSFKIKSWLCRPVLLKYPKVSFVE